MLRYHCYRAENCMESISRRCRIRPGRLLYCSNQTGYKDYTISFSGKIVTGGTTGTNNNKIDTIEIDSYSRAYPDGTVKKYVVKGMKYTGWDDEMKEYNDFVNEGKFK